MIIYEIQLRYVISDKIRGKIQSETKKSVRDKIQEKKFCCKRKARKKLSEKKLSRTVSDKSMLIITKWYVHTAISDFQASRHDLVSPVVIN